MTSNRFNTLAMLTLCVAVFTGCGDDDASNNDEANNGANNGAVGIELVGTWDNDFGTSEEITVDTWAGTPIVSYDNENNFTVFQNASDAEFDPDKFAKVVWTEIEADSFYYCWVAFGLDTEQEALDAADTSDATDPATTGCGDFAWTKLTRQ